MQPPDLQALLAKWQHLFRLQDRKITIGYVQNLVNPVTGDSVYGLLRIQNPAEGRFRIEIQDLSTWPSNADRPPTLRTIENAIRHECGHIRVNDFAPQNPTDADILAEERAVWAISDAFDAFEAGEYPRVAAMVVHAMNGPKTLSQVAANVRAMTANPAAMRHMQKGKSMDALAISAALAVIMAASPEDQPKLLAELKTQIDAAAGQPDNAAPPSELPMNQDAGDGMPDEKDKASVDYMRAMRTELASVRAMKADVARYRNEAKTAADMLRPEAKLALIRGMRADGVNVTPHGEKLILEAPSLEVAKERAEGMRAMGAMPVKSQHRQSSTTVGLTRAQQKEYDSISRTNPVRADMYRDECVAANSKGGAK